MSFFGIGNFESEEAKLKREAEYLKSIFPFGKAQKYKIIEILKQIYPKIDTEELTYNYTITKQQIGNNNIKSISRSELMEILAYLNKFYLSKNTDVSIYLSLVDIDNNVDENLNYPDIDEIKKNALELSKLL